MPKRTSKSDAGITIENLPAALVVLPSPVACYLLVLPEVYSRSHGDSRSKHPDLVQVDDDRAAENYVA
ncbi:MAG: hypothetical protein MI923_22420 [Phycisphaerales bacterium]|nr:hypothetical protein [Phycisphaerales bacterium]